LDKPNIRTPLGAKYFARDHWTFRSYGAWKKFHLFILPRFRLYEAWNKYAGKNAKLMNNEQNVQECDATEVS